MALFDEFEAQQTNEAKIVHSGDKLQAVAQNVLTSGKAWKEHQLGLEWIEGYHKPSMLHDQTFMKLYSILFQEIVDKKLAWN